MKTRSFSWILLVNCLACFLCGSILTFCYISNNPIVTLNVTNATKMEIEKLSIIGRSDLMEIKQVYNNIRPGGTSKFEVLVKGGGLGYVISGTYDNGAKINETSDYTLPGTYNLKISQ